MNSADIDLEGNSENLEDFAETALVISFHCLEVPVIG